MRTPATSALGALALAAGMSTALAPCARLGHLAAQEGVPASTNVRGAEYPRVREDRRVEMRLRAPGAKDVSLSPGGDDNGLGKGPIPMERGEDGTWTVVTPPAVPGFHYYWFTVDGLAVNDPGSETFFGWGRMTSGIEVPEPNEPGEPAEPGPADSALRDVPHGDVRMVSYRSDATGQWRRAFVYCPPGYDADFARRYPVLYLQHGAGEDERGWSAQGRAGIILDNLIARGAAVPMLVVMDCGYAEFREGWKGRDGSGAGSEGGGAGSERGGAESERSGAGNERGRAGGERRDARFRATEAFEEVLLHELIPAIDARFRTLADREHRAMAGLSMGGGQTLRIAPAHLDVFASFAAFSAPLRGPLDDTSPLGRAVADPAAFERQVRVLWIGAGTEERRILEGTRQLHEALETAGIRHVLSISEGTAHEWLTWRRALADFAPRIFRDEEDARPQGAGTRKP